MRTAVEDFREHLGRLPHALGELTVPLPGKPDGYLSLRGEPRDLRGRPFLYEVGRDGSSYELVRAGPAGAVSLFLDVPGVDSPASYWDQ